MKTFLKKILVAALVFIAALSTINLTGLTTGMAHANTAGFTGRTGGNCGNFLGMTSWDCGVQIVDGDQDSLVNGIILIGTNILSDLAVLSAYLVLGYTIYGGYLYIFSSGDPGKSMNGKKTLNRAFIGLAIVGGANIILSAIRIAFLGQSGSFAGDCELDNISVPCLDANDFVTNTINWFIGTAGVISLVFVVVGAVGYITSAGDAGKLQKAKNTILYSLIGLAIVALSAVITATVSNIIRDAETNTTSFNNNIVIAKELA